MRTRLLAVTILALALSGCATIYSKDREWRLPAGLGEYVISARITSGFFVREAVISFNGRPLLKGRSYWWSNTIDMASTIDELPVTASCDRKARFCRVMLANFLAVTIPF